MSDLKVHHKTIATWDGVKLGRRLNAYLRDPHVTSLFFVTYRYHDFDPQTGKKLDLGPNSIIKKIGEIASSGAQVTFVTRDPTTDENPLNTKEANLWMKGLEYLSKQGASVYIHSSLHAKVYAVEREEDNVFFSVGSSNLTKQGMGYKWSECNIVSWNLMQYADLKKEIYRILSDKKNISTLREWNRKSRRNQGLRSLAYLRQT